jgi:hypothetical protein
MKKAPPRRGETTTMARELSGADVRTPHCALRAQIPKAQDSKPPKITAASGRRSIWDLSFSRLGFARIGAFASPLAFTSGGPKIDFARPCSGALGFVMRYRSATVAGLHGLPC